MNTMEVAYVEPEDEDTAELEIDWGIDDNPHLGPVCTCGFFPDPDCVIDHMGRNKPDPEKPGGNS